MNIQTCKYVNGTEIFEGLGLAWIVFINSDPNCTWGDNNRSMVTADVIYDALEQSDLNVGNEERQVNLVLGRLKEVPEGVYVDLEN
jgi:hypothetical protein